MRPNRIPTAAAMALGALLAGCAGSGDEAGPVASGLPTEDLRSRVAVATNHCFVEPVRFDGELWNVPFDHQFGWGGLQPRRWRGSGVMVRVAEDRARFEDEGGSTVIFLPVDHPSVRPVEGALCQ